MTPLIAQVSPLLSLIRKAEARGDYDIVYVGANPKPLKPITQTTDSVIRQGSEGYVVNEVILHTSATGPDWWHGKSVEQMRDEIRSWHTSPGWQGSPTGWKDIGYHFVVAPDGSVATGRPLSVIGAHVKERNRGTVGVCMIPVREVDRMGRFEDFYTEAQRKAVKSFIAYVEKRTPLARVSGHNDYAPKLCPGFRVVSDDWMPSGGGWWARLLGWFARFKHQPKGK